MKGTTHRSWNRFGRGLILILLSAMSSCSYATPCRLSWDADRAKSAKSLEYECADLSVQMTVSASVSHPVPWKMQIVLEIENRSDTDVLLDWMDNEAVCDDARSATRETAFVDEKCTDGAAVIPSGRKRRVAVNYQISFTDSEALHFSTARVELGQLLQTGTNRICELPRIFVFPYSRRDGAPGESTND